MPIQRQCESRFVHPHIYEWPLTDFKENKAGLPILSWTADSAAGVVDQIGKAWDKLCDLPHISRVSDPPNISGSRLKITTNCNDVSLERTPDGFIIANEIEPFDIVILAVGFGSDKYDPGTPGYWEDQKKDFERDTKLVWCFSGIGDGGLTDLMWRCIITFRHESLLSKIVEKLDESDLDLLKKISGSPDATKNYTDIEIVESDFARLAKKLKPLKSELRGAKKVLLVGPGKELFAGGRSVLNRLIVAFLVANNAFEFVRGKLYHMEEKEGRFHLVIKCDDGSTRLETCDHLIERYGPKSVLESDFNEIYKACAGLRDEWKALSIADDFSRRPLYRYQDFIDGLSPDNFAKGYRVRANQDGRIACLVVKTSAPEKSGPLENWVQLGLTNFKRAVLQRFPGREISLIPYCVSAVACFEDAELYEWTVRALCDCEFAVFDLTGTQPSSLTLLGIRAAARRGVTVTVSQDPLVLSKLPFNIADLNPLPLSKNFPLLLSAAFDKGLAALQAQPESYLDLPAFDSLRRLCEGAGMIPADQEVLLLCWFDIEYQERVAGLVKALIPQIDACAGTKVVTTLDSGSPQLVAQRLYSAIRRAQLCLIDWTGWRPNVFFELGVRLAVNELDPIHMLCPEEPRYWNETGTKWPTAPEEAEILEAFFKPLKFANDNTGKIEHRICEFLADDRATAEGATTSSGRTYRLVQECIRQRHGVGELGVRSPDELLLTAAKALAGPAVQETGTPPILYPNALTTIARDVAFENLLAAWFYLLGRYPELSSLASTDTQKLREARTQLFTIAKEIETRHEAIRRPDFTRFVEQVRDIRDRIQNENIQSVS